MKVTKVTTAMILDTRRKKKSGAYPVKIRITYRRVQRYFPTDIDLTQEEWDAVQSARPRGDAKNTALMLAQIEARANKIITDLPVFSFDAFRRLFLHDPGDRENIFTFFSEAENTARDEDRHGTAESYRLASNALAQFNRSRKLFFSEVTPEYVRRFDRWMRERGRSGTTVRIYISALRRMFNAAMEQQVITREAYPFGKGKYQVPRVRKTKKGLTADQVRAVFEYPADPTSSEAWARDMFIFSYLCQGINVADIARLTWADMDGDRVVFTRQKTSTTKRQDEPINAVLHPRAQKVIETWSDRGTRHVFPILSARMNEEEKRRRVKNETRAINRRLSAIGEKVGIGPGLSIGVARHSFATILSQSGVPVALISSLLGHSSIAVTEHYLAGFEDEHKRKALENLTPWEDQPGERASDT